MPTVPSTTWEQIPVIVIFSFLLAGMAWLMVKIFSAAIADINQHYADIVKSNNAHYAEIIKGNNEQWQKYFDARADTNAMVNNQTVEKLDRLTEIIQKLAEELERHSIDGHKTKRRTN